MIRHAGVTLSCAHCVAEVDGAVLGTNVTTNTMTAPDCSALPPSLYPLPSIRGKTIKILSILPLITEAQGPGRDGAMMMLIGDKEDALLCSKQ